MDVGIGLPSTIPEIPGGRIAEWAVAAEDAGFRTLGTIDRLVYPNVESIPALAAAAAVTDRIGLTTSILIAAYRGNGALLAKQLSSIDLLSDGRLTVGIAVGGREDDYEATGSPFRERGRTFDRQLAEMRAVWAGEPRGFAGPIGPAPVQPGGPPLLLGGTVEATYRRMVDHGAGWIAGGGGPDMFAAGAAQARQAWSDAGRDGQPRLVALTYAVLSDDAKAYAQRYLGDYYGFLGDFAQQIVAGALTTPTQVTDTISAFTDAGCDELILFPCNPDIGQVELLAEAAKL